MRQQRWVHFAAGVDPHDFTRRGFATAVSKNIPLPDGSTFAEVEFTSAGQLLRLQKDARLRVMPPLETGQARLPQADQDLLATLEVTVQADDRVLNVLRAVRNKFAPGAGYDISSPF